MQVYYLSPRSDFFQYAEQACPGSMDYIQSRCEQIVIPAITALQFYFRQCHWPVIFLELASRKTDRSDLHPAFLKAHREAANQGFENLYPQENQDWARTLPEIAPHEGELVLTKTTFSGFTSSNLEELLKSLKVSHLVMTGLATSQCVDTTARDAADRGFEILHMEDAQADYTREFHHASLYASQGICGGNIFSSEAWLKNPQWD